MQLHWVSICPPHLPVHPSRTAKAIPGAERALGCIWPAACPGSGALPGGPGLRPQRTSGLSQADRLGQENMPPQSRAGHLSPWGSALAPPGALASGLNRLACPPRESPDCTPAPGHLLFWRAGFSPDRSVSRVLDPSAPSSGPGGVWTRTAGADSGLGCEHLDQQAGGRGPQGDATAGQAAVTFLGCQQHPEGWRGSRRAASDQLPLPPWLAAFSEQDAGGGVTLARARPQLPEPGRGGGASEGGSRLDPAWWVPGPATTTPRHLCFWRARGSAAHPWLPWQ